MNIKKMPYGISNYEKIVNDGYYYVDKTMYIEKLENLPETSIMFLRPRKFGKTLFTSVLEYYYDKNKEEKFENLYKDTYIGKNPTKNKNSYCILRFNFSGINTENEETTMKGFKNKTIASIRVFIKKYGLDFYINQENETEDILNDLHEKIDSLTIISGMAKGIDGIAMRTAIKNNDNVIAILGSGIDNPYPKENIDI